MTDQCNRMQLIVYDCNYIQKSWNLLKSWNPMKSRDFEISYAILAWFIYLFYLFLFLLV